MQGLPPSRGATALGTACGKNIHATLLDGDGTDEALVSKAALGWPEHEPAAASPNTSAGNGAG